MCVCNINDPQRVVKYFVHMCTKKKKKLVSACLYPSLIRVFAGLSSESQISKASSCGKPKPQKHVHPKKIMISLRISLAHMSEGTQRHIISHFGSSYYLSGIYTRFERLMSYFVAVCKGDYAKRKEFAPLFPFRVDPFYSNMMTAIQATHIHSTSMFNRFMLRLTTRHL